MVHAQSSSYNVYPMNPVTRVYPTFSSSLSSSALNKYFADSSLCQPPVGSSRKTAVHAENFVVHDSMNGNEEYRRTERYFYDVKTTTSTFDSSKLRDQTFVTMSDKMSTELQNSLSTLKDQLYKITQQWTSPMLMRKNTVNTADHRNSRPHTLRRTVSEKFIRPLPYFHQPPVLSVFDSAGCHADDVDVIDAYTQRFVRSYFYY